jgi:hypothetical protein
MKGADLLENEPFGAGRRELRRYYRKIHYVLASAATKIGSNATNYRKIRCVLHPECG